MYPTDHVFIFFGIFIFLQIFLINISIKTRSNPKKTNCIPERRLNVFTALGHMLMASAQRWLYNQCCRCVFPCPDYKTLISGDCSDLTVWYVGICDVKCWILLTFLFTWQYTTWKYNYFTLFRCFKIVFWRFRIFC